MVWLLAICLIFFPILPLATLFALLQMNFLLNLELSSPLMVFGPFHSLLRDFGIGYLQIFVLAPQLLVLKADSLKTFLFTLFLDNRKLISYLIFLFNHFRFFID